MGLKKSATETSKPPYLWIKARSACDIRSWWFRCFCRLYKYEYEEMSVIRDIAVFLCGFLTLRLVRGQVLLPGACPDVPAMKDFIPSRYLGRWYEAEKYFAAFEFLGRCITADYGEKDNGILEVTNKQISSITGIKTMIQGEANQVSRSDEGKLSVRFPSLPVNFAAPYWVIDTDYDNYAVVWSCYDFGIFHSRNAWILTRERRASISTLEKAYAVIDKNNISRSYFMRTDQDNCPEDDQKTHN